MPSSPGSVKPDTLCETAPNSILLKRQEQMVGRLGRNLRKGHRAEDLGVSVLRAFCAVAQVRQEDDVGLDAVATLLEDDGPRLRAGNSFAVQFKARSVDSITYAGDEIEWFLGQRLPFFIARADLASGGLELFPTSPGRQVIMHRAQTERLELRLEPKYRSGLFAPPKDGTFIVGVGPPLLVCSQEEARTDEFANRAFAIMEDWLRIEHQLIDLGRISRGFTPKWDTWVKPEPFSFYSRGSSEELGAYMREAEPYIDKLAQAILFAEASEQFEVALAFILLARWFREQGLDVDFDDQMDWRTRWPDRGELLGDARSPFEGIAEQFGDVGR